MNFARRHTRTGGIISLILGLIALGLVFASGASAHTAGLTATSQCDGQSGNWKAVFTAKNDIDAKYGQATISGTGTPLDGRKLSAGGGTAQLTLNQNSGAKSVTVSGTVTWNDGYHVGISATAYQPDNCAPKPSTTTATVTESVPGPTVTVPGPTQTATVVISETKTVTETPPAQTETIPGPTTTVITPGPTVTVTETQSVPGPTTTETQTATETATATATATSTETQTATVSATATQTVTAMATVTQTEVQTKTATVTQTVAGPATTVTVTASNGKVVHVKTSNHTQTQVVSVSNDKLPPGYQKRAGGLAQTGSDNTVLTMLGTALVCVGLGALYVGRRKGSHTA